MIKINLCPLDELDSPYWYVPDVVAAAIVAVAVFFATQYYLGNIQDQIDVVVAEAASLDENTAKLTPDLEKFKNLGKDIADLNSKLSALKSITVSKISKYKPVIILEHLQNLKPEGVWFETVRIGFNVNAAKTGAAGGAGSPQPAQAQAQAQAQEVNEDGFEVKGQAFDHILTAEFMTAIRSTENQEIDSGDLRTQVYFNELTLIDANINKAAAGREFPEMANYPVFNLRGHFSERSAQAHPVTPEQPSVGAIDKGPKAPADAPVAPPVQAPVGGDVSLRHAPLRGGNAESDMERSRRF
jgi:Tfp pilus assembly protein PilN